MAQGLAQAGGRPEDFTVRELLDRVREHREEMERLTLTSTAGARELAEMVRAELQSLELTIREMDEPLSIRRAVAATSKPVLAHADQILAAAEESQDALLTVAARIQQALATAEARQAGVKDEHRPAEARGLRDPLTDCFTRETCLADLADLLSPPRAMEGLALAPVAVTGLQDVNSLLGYAAGDKVLSVIGRLLRSHVGPIGQPYRYGGGNFLVLCRGIALAAVEPHLTRFAKAVAEFRFHKAGTRIPIAVRHAFCPVAPDATAESAVEDAFRALLPPPP